ncbi:MAG: O-methyltransferase [Eubacteriales bacterium]|nr:O-methyltransferase [Eubacteriales bacterium]
MNKKRINDFINSYKNNNSKLYYLKQFANFTNVPIIKDDTEDFIKLILSIHRPKKILEIGAAIGYSSLMMSSILSDSHITTIENDEIRVKFAKENIKKYNSAKKIKLVFEDATTYLKKINNKKFDFIFLDAAKGQYYKWFNDIYPLMKKNSILIADNIFKEYEILESLYTIKKRERTIHNNMRKFLYVITHNKNLYTSIFNIGDGISVSIRV